MVRRRLTQSADSWKRLDSPREARRPQLLNWSASDWFEAGLKKARAPEPCGSFARSDVGRAGSAKPVGLHPFDLPSSLDKLEKKPARRYYLRLIRWPAMFFLTIWISTRRFRYHVLGPDRRSFDVIPCRRFLAVAGWALFGWPGMSSSRVW